MLNLNLYECVFILKPEITQENLDLFLKNCREELQKDQGTVESVEHWGVRDLAYPIKKVNRGNYVMLKVSTSNNSLTNLNDFVKFHHDMLRHVTFRVDGFDEEPSELSLVNQYQNKSNSYHHKNHYDNRRNNHHRNQDSDTTVNDDSAATPVPNDQNSVAENNIAREE